MVDTAELGGTTVRYRVDGPGDAAAVLLVNSLGTDHGMWRRQAAALVGPYRVVRYDARGQGGVPAPPPPYRLADLGADALALLDHLAIDRAHVVGVSLGGIVALWLAIHHPDRLLGAVFANTAARIGTAEGWDERIEAVRRGGMSSVSGQVMERFFSDRFRTEHSDTVAETAETFEAHDPEGYIGHCTALRDADLRAGLGRIELPALVVAGSADVSTPPELSRWLHERIARAELVELAGAGHLSNLERPERFNDAVGRHLQRADGRLRQDDH